MTDVFISYARQDEAAAREMVDRLTTAGHEVWWDREIYLGARWPTQIEAALNSAKCVIVLWSESSALSEWVPLEAGEALNRGILLPVSLDGALPPLRFRDLQTLDLQSAPSGEEDALDLLVTAAGQLLRGERPKLAAPPAGLIRKRRAARRRLVVGAIGLAGLLVVAWLAYLTTRQVATVETPQDPRLEKARELAAQAFVITPNHIDARGHLESARPRICIGSDIDSVEWKNLLRAFHLSDELEVWSLSPTYLQEMTDGTCLITLFSRDQETEAKNLMVQLDEQGDDPPYRSEAFGELFEDWEIGLDPP